MVKTETRIENRRLKLLELKNQTNESISHKSKSLIDSELKFLTKLSANIVREKNSVKLSIERENKKRREKATFEFFVKICSKMTIQRLIELNNSQNHKIVLQIALNNYDNKKYRYTKNLNLLKCLYCGKKTYDLVFNSLDRGIPRCKRCFNSNR